MAYRDLPSSTALAEADLLEAYHANARRHKCTLTFSLLSVMLKLRARYVHATGAYENGSRMPPWDEYKRAAAKRIDGLLRNHADAFGETSSLYVELRADAKWFRAELARTRAIAGGEHTSNVAAAEERCRCAQRVVRVVRRRARSMVYGASGTTLVSGHVVSVPSRLPRVIDWDKEACPGAGRGALLWVRPASPPPQLLVRSHSADDRESEDEDDAVSPQHPPKTFCAETHEDEHARAHDQVKSDLIRIQTCIALNGRSFRLE